MGLQPDLARTAQNPVGLVMGRLIERLERAAKLDNVTVAIFPIVQIAEIFDDLVDVHEQSTALAKARRQIRPE